jgi:hypothetical protein
MVSFSIALHKYLSLTMATSLILQDLGSPEPPVSDGSTSYSASLYNNKPFLDKSGLCSHAVAHGTRVYGIRHTSSSSEIKHPSSTKNWWTWHADFSPHQVNSVTSNENGSVIACVTAGGTVSLLRGCDGQVLVTRQVLPEGDFFDCNSAVSLSWIFGKKAMDFLLVEAPPSNLILVLHIDGTTLNRLDNPELAATALRQMQIQSLPTVHDWRAMAGCLTTKSISDCQIRFVAVNSDGNLVVLDYSIESRSFVTVCAKVPLSRPENEPDAEWTVNHELGFRSQMAHDTTFFVFSASREQNTAMVWFDPTSLQIALRFDNLVPGKRRSKVVASEPVRPLSAHDTLALAVAVKSSSSTTADASIRIFVVQVLVEETMGLMILSEPHIVYTVLIDESAILSISVACVNSPETDFLPFSFRLKLWRCAGDCVYKVFTPHESTSNAVGKFRKLLARADFDGADNIVSATSNLDALIGDPFATFHPSEAALKRLQSWLHHGDMTRAEQPNICIQRLVDAAASGNKKALYVLFEAIDSVVKNSTNRSLSDMILALTAFSANLADVAKVLSEDDANDLAIKHKLLEGKLEALKALRCVSSDVVLRTPLHSIRSPSHLFAVFLKKGNMSEAEQFCRSGGIFQLTSEELVSPVLNISNSVKPSLYVPMLRDFIMPRLFVNDDLLVHLRAWACRTADALDDRNQADLNLDAAILLLKVRQPNGVCLCTSYDSMSPKALLTVAMPITQTIDRGTKELRVKSHSSFASFCPFVDAIEGRRGRSPRTKTTRLASFTVNATSSQEGKARQQLRPRILPSAGRPIPTLLELGALRGGAAKLRSGLDHQNEDDTDYEGNDECVESKLRDALCLQKSRGLGLEREVVKLRTFDADGGAPFVAKELARHLSSKSIDHDSRVASFVGQLRPFCDQFTVSCDDALLASVKEMCRSQFLTKLSVIESSSIARCCSSALSKCKAALLVLRAAILCGHSPDWFADLSRDAIAWASCDSALQSELEEATRLLSIDHIVLKYCGPGSKELFRVDNPRHAVRLLSFVTKHIQNSSVISDVLALCDAFHHLSREDAVSSVLFNCLHHGQPERSVQLLQELFSKDLGMAHQALVRSLACADDFLDECSRNARLGDLDSSRIGALRLVEHAIELLTCALDYIKTFVPHANAALRCFLKDGKLVTLRSDFLRIFRLQQDHRLYASLGKLSSPVYVLEETIRLVSECITSFRREDSSSVRTNLTAARRACALLAGDSKLRDSVWSMAASVVVARHVSEVAPESILDLLEDLSMLVQPKTEHLTLAQMSVAMSCCQDALSTLESFSSIGLQRIGVATALLKDWALISCPETMTANVVSLGSNIDLVCHILTRSDEGMGENLVLNRQSLQTKAWNINGISELRVRDTGSAASLCQPKLHPGWYVGDGLLIPPRLALTQSLRFSKWVSFAHLNEECSGERLVDFISGHGAYFLTLRVLSNWSAVLLSRLTVANEEGHIEALLGGFEDTKVSLAERSLGGSGTGITNAVVDSDLALSYLLCLPLKQAFKTYKSCLPTAAKTRDFQRLLNLANVGLVAANSGSEFGDVSCLPSSWSGQRKLFEQCKQIACRAKWSIALERYGIIFDPQGLDDQIGAGSVDTLSATVCSYVGSLLPFVISVFSRSLCPFDVISLATLFAETFGLSRDLVIETHVEFLLSSNGSGHFVSEQRSKLPGQSECERSTRASLRLLSSSLRRASVLRRCLVTLEGDQASSTAYEHIGLALALYQEALTCVVHSDMAVEVVDLAPFESELELIDRRRDAITILLSFYGEKQEIARPPFSSFFAPLEVPFPQSPTSKAPRCGVLGGKRKNGDFDPIAALETTFKDYPDSATASSLAPLCLPLGLPTGYIHARSLVVRFLEARTARNAFPSFSNDILPVCERLRSSYDKAILAEWCSEQYVCDVEEKLKCLNLSLKSAMLASTDIETRRQQNMKDSELEGMEKTALDTVKRISMRSDVLSDRIRVKTILRSSGSQLSVNGMTEAIIRKLDNLPDALSPESIISFVLEEGALVAAESCLDLGAASSIEQLRTFSSVVYEACNAIAEQHSHIHPYQRSIRFARKWLLHGDEMRDRPTATVERSFDSFSSQHGQAADVGDDTVDFVMDLADRQAGGDWNPSVGCQKNKVRRQLTSDEESSSVKEISSREMSDKACRRASLRIAFVLAFPQPADEYPKGKENKSSPTNLAYPQAPSRCGLLSKIETKRDRQHEGRIFDLCKELLRIVFAGSASSVASLIKLSLSFDAAEIDIGDSVHVPKTITFAMRHRALRAASVLCPQEALEQVMRSEALVPATSSGEPVSLKQCTFGSFIAKEIEEMGLPLPHADLARLSTMHFLSYARTLWRHHRGNEMEKGRLLVLLVEMSLTDRETDQDFVGTILQEMIRLRLPRSLLLAMECVQNFAYKWGSTQVVTGLPVQRALDTIYSCIGIEIRGYQPNASRDEFEMGAYHTIERLYEIVSGLGLCVGVNPYLEQFLEFTAILTNSPSSRPEHADIVHRIHRLRMSVNSPRIQ